MSATGDFLENQNQNPATSSELESGLAVVQSHQAEELRRIVVEHMRRHPLAPLEEETILVQSTGTARWLQLALAVDADDENAPGLGISASTDFLLPARFFWGAYRIVLGDEALPEESPFDTDRLRWRILSLLPGLVEGTGYEPLAAYLAHDSANPRRRWQLACALADLYEQYQFYRADWLMSWEKGVDTVSDARGNSRDIDERQRWQPALWRAILESMPESRRQQSRAHLHHRFLAALESAEADGHDLTGLPRRLVVFGISSLPMQMIEGLAALAHHCQVLVCLHNPCRHYWADIIEGRDLLRSTPGKRLARRHDWPEQLDESRLHQLANPLLAAWGRQGRDFQDLLGEFDEPERYRDWFARIDVFDEHETAEDRSLLQRIQQGILDLRPDPSDPASRELVTSDDRSLRFHIAHSRQREVEILHDQLLAAWRRMRHCNLATSSSWSPTSTRTRRISTRYSVRMSTMRAISPTASATGVSARSPHVSRPLKRCSIFRDCGSRRAKSSTFSRYRRCVVDSISTRTKSSKSASGWVAPASAGACMGSTASAWVSILLSSRTAGTSAFAECCSGTPMARPMHSMKFSHSKKCRRLG